MNEEDARRKHIYIVARDQANQFSRFYLNLRIAAFSFTLLAVGAIVVFGWNAVFHEPFSKVNTIERYLRFVVLSTLWMTLFGSTWFEIALSRRYQVTWEESKKFELRLEGIGLHSLIERSRAGLRHPARVSFAYLITVLLVVTLVEGWQFWPWWTAEELPRLISWIRS